MLFIQDWRYLQYRLQYSTPQRYFRSLVVLFAGLICNDRAILLVGDIDFSTVLHNDTFVRWS
jgi:hypothetical protein